ncbi:MAG: VWA domain-containing protein [Nannocystaceae bacterium]
MAAFAISGCRGGKPIEPDGGPGGGGGPTVLVSDDGSFHAPPHVFNPRPHQPRIHNDPPPPNLASLPKMVERHRQCFGQPVEKDRSSGSIGLGNSGAIGKGGGGSRGSAFGSGGGRAPSKPSPKAKKVSSKYSVPYQPGGAGDGLAAGPAPTPAAPPPVTQSAPPADKTDTIARKESRRDRKAREKAERKAASAPEAEAAPMEAAGADFADEDVASEELRVATSEAPAPEPDPDLQYDDWGASIYLSNDDTMSLSSAQRVLFAIDKFLPVPLEHIRPHELLNYFSFETDEVAQGDDFSVRASIAPDPNQEGIYTLALGVRGRPMDLRSRRNANLTLVIDRSGSMTDEGRMEYLKRGLNRMVSELKQGDLVNVVLFDHRECTPLENFVVGRDNPDVLRKTIARLRPEGATDIHLGLTKGYDLADRAYQPTYTNRVILVTDALANTGVTDERMIGMIGKFYDQRRIRLSGVGVGREFNDSLLDQLTERGRGAYVFLGSEAEVDAVFGPRFISLIETTADDVHFRLHMPPSLRMNVFYGEESSVHKEDVQAIHYFANTSQLFLSDLMARGKRLRPEDWVMLTVEYEDPETGAKIAEDKAFNLGDISRDSLNIRKGRMLMRWADGLAEMSMRPLPSSRFGGAGTWIDDDGWGRCQEIGGELRTLSVGLADREVARVNQLWEKFCARYERPRNPVRRTPQTQQDSWPGASG